MKRLMTAILLLALHATMAPPTAQQGGRGAPGGGGQQAQPGGGAATWTPKRVNKAIELLEMGQPIYYTQIDGGGYEDGQRLART